MSLFSAMFTSHQRTGPRPRYGLWVGFLLIGWLMTPTGALIAQETATFDIPPQSLSLALTSFAEQSSWQLFYSAKIVEGLESQGVSGTYTPETALARLLAGTCLTYLLTGDKTVTVEPQGAPSTPETSFENHAPRASDPPPGPRAEAPSNRRKVRIPAVTVLGSRRTDIPLSNVPSSISLLNQEDIQEERPTTNRIEDILSRRIPGFNPTNNGVRQIRGRTAQVFLNGVPVNEQLRASSGSDLNLINPDQLAGVEVSRGANSAYGFGSPGGIIALQTPRATSKDLTLRTTIRESFNPQQIGGSHQITLYQSVAQIVDKFDYHLGGSLGYDGADFDPNGDLALGFNNSALLTNGKEILGSLDGSFGFDFGTAGTLRLAGTFGYVDFLKQYELNPGIYRQQFGSLVENPKGDQSFRKSYTVNMTYQNPDVFGNAVKLEAFTSRIETQVFSSFGGTNFRDEQTNTYYGIRSSVTTPLSFVTKGTAITYGFDFLRNRYFRPFFNDDTGMLSTFFSPDVTLDSFAPYGQLELPLGDFIFTGGVRHEEYRGHVETAAGPSGITGGNINAFHLTLFNAGLVYFLNQSIDLYFTFSQGAEISQLGRAARSAASADQIDPQPAKSNQYEVGLRGNWPGLTVGVSGFYTESDLLSSLICDGINPCIPLREPREFWGMEGTAEWRINRQWNLGGVLTWQDGIRKTETDDTRRISSSDVPPILVTGYVDFSPFAWWRNRIQLNYRGSRNPFGASTEFGEGRVTDLILLNLSAGFDIGPGVLQIGVQNLLNTQYTSIPAEAGNSDFLWLPEQGTRISTSYTLSW